MNQHISPFDSSYHQLLKAFPCPQACQFFQANGLKMFSSTWAERLLPETKPEVSPFWNLKRVALASWFLGFVSTILVQLLM